MITVLGPEWPTTTYLRGALREVPEEGEFRLGGPPRDSIEQLTAFREAGLLTPEFTTNREEACQWVQAGFTVFGRKLIHTRGNDIVLPWRLTGMLPRPRGRWWNSDWWSKYIPPTEEWRVHVFNGRSIARGKKILTHPDEVWRHAPVRNIGNGWTFDFTATPPKGLRRTAKAAIGAVEYPHGAVDILQVVANDPTAPEGPTNEFYVLECNRIPALTCPYTREAWVEAIRRYVRGIS